MKGSLIVLDTLNGRPAAALIEDGVLSDLLIDPAETLSPGAILRAVVDRPVKGQGGVFLKGPDGARAFLRQTKGLAQGQALLVQVTGFAEPGKALPVTPRILFKSRFAIVTPDAPGLNISRSIRDDDRREALLELAHEGMAEAPDGIGLILRSVAETANDQEVAADIAAMLDTALAVTGDAGSAPELLLDAPTAHERAWRDWAAPDHLVDAPSGFEDHGVLDAIDMLSLPAPLPGGGTLFVQPTRALVAVDVNTGADTSAAAGTKANFAAARALPRLLRVMGLGGQITVDFAPMPKKDRRQLEQSLKAAFRADPVDTTLAGWTPLGNYELQRKRERLPLREALAK